jgi:hypothetical protein
MAQAVEMTAAGALAVVEIATGPAVEAVPAAEARNIQRGKTSFIFAQALPRSLNISGRCCARLNGQASFFLPVFNAEMWNKRSNLLEITLPKSQRIESKVAFPLTPLLRFERGVYSVCFSLNFRKEDFLARDRI